MGKIDWKQTWANIKDDYDPHDFPNAALAKNVGTTMKKTQAKAKPATLSFLNRLSKTTSREGKLTQREQSKFKPIRTRPRNEQDETNDLMKRYFEPPQRW